MKLILNFLDKQEKNKYKLLVALSFLSSIFDSLGILSVLPFISILSNPKLFRDEAYIFVQYVGLSDELLALSDNDLQFAVGLGSAIIILLGGVLKILSLKLNSIFIYNQERLIGKKILTTLLNSDFKHIKSQKSSVITKNILSDVSFVVNGALKPMMSLIGSLLTIVIMIIVVSIVNASAALTTISIFGVMYLIFYLLKRKSVDRTGNMRLVLNQQRFKAIKEILIDIKRIKLRNIEKNKVEYFDSILSRFAKTQSDNIFLAGYPKYLFETVAFSVMILFLLFQYSNNNSFINNLPFYSFLVLAAYRLLPSIQLVFSAIIQIRNSYPTVISLSESVQDNISEKYNDLPNTDKFSHIYSMTDIHLHNLSFSYSSNGSAQIYDINLKIKKGEKIVIIGKSGSGKSTLLDIILGLIPPTLGDVKVNDKSIKIYNISDFQKKISYIPQFYFPNNDTVAQNIKGSKCSDSDLLRVKQLLKLCAFSKSEIERLLDPSFIINEDGSNLSGGQIRRLGIASALFLSYEVIILDEATTGLDSESAYKIMKNIIFENPQSTIISVTHNFKELNLFDRIIVLEKGRVVNDIKNFDDEHVSHLINKLGC